MKAVFISDLHLRDDFEPNAQLLRKLLNRMVAGHYTHLFLLGDVFDLWIADHKYFSGRFGSTIDKLRELRDAGVEIHYFEGNHDLDLRPFFERKMGMIVHENAVTLNLLGQRIRIEHGDQMDPDDRDYLFLRWLLRTPPVRWLGRHLPGKAVNWIGETASAKSRDYTTGVRERVDTAEMEKKLLDHARRVLDYAPFDVLIAGHVHMVMDRSFVDGRTHRVINLGTWLDQPMMFEISEGRFNFVPVDKFLSGESADNATVL
jgi:UDP-2,3-diacylglucosamine hydrolase